MAKLQAIPVNRIQISCRVINGSTYRRPTKIKTIFVDYIRPEDYNTECYKMTEPNLDCWYNFTFIKPIVYFLGLQRH